VLPITAPGVRGGAVAKVIAGLLRRGLAEERIDENEPDPDRVLRRDDAGRAILLVASDAAVEILGGVGEAKEDDGVASEPAAQANAPAAETDQSAPAPRVRAGTKQATLVAMLRAEGGATLDEIVEATGWQPHTVRGAMSGALKKRLGLTIASEKVDGRGRAYRIIDA